MIIFSQQTMFWNLRGITNLLKKIVRIKTLIHKDSREKAKKVSKEIKNDEIFPVISVLCEVMTKKKTELCKNSHSHDKHEKEGVREEECLLKRQDQPSQVRSLVPAHRSS